MPVTRRSTRSSTTGAAAAAAGPGKQAKISFKSRVTKSIKDGEKKGQEEKKKPYQSPARSKEWKPVADDEQGKEEEEDEEEKKVKVEEGTDTEDAVVGSEVPEVVKSAPPATKATQVDDEFALRARKITDAGVNRYWKQIEDSRMAKEVHKKHTEGLETGEKVLRYFDVSSQYGPCIGITRLKRWQRANRLGLHPPIEVLAVLLKEEEKGNEKRFEKAHMDELLSSTALGSV
ncbi:DNA polymerase delta subunit 4 [Cladorrhinum samala]|uniref:DNA polymerase delta subunit 4 n=1 Tax=Cladorrhinum samala TaxID=585594 RepID=A0AAV9HDE1_9PEZI|nr:DNA polymerase delta subunit 4 [Cladorrhinum samala]